MTAQAGDQGADGTVGKALGVLDQVASLGRPARFSEILALSEHPKATVYRIVRTLTRQGMLAFDPDRQTYAPGVRLVRLAHAAWAQSSLAPVARPYLDALSAQVGETVHLAQLDNAQVLYIDKRNPTEPVEMYSQAGKVGPAYCTGVGKAMLAHLDEATLENVLTQQSFHRFTDHTHTSAASLKAEGHSTPPRAQQHRSRQQHGPGRLNLFCAELQRPLDVVARKWRIGDQHIVRRLRASLPHRVEVLPAVVAEREAVLPVVHLHRPLAVEGVPQPQCRVWRATGQAAGCHDVQHVGNIADGAL